jgi:hypothetical protein
MTNSLFRNRLLAISLCIALVVLSAASLLIDASPSLLSLLETDAVGSQWSAMNGQASGPAAAEQQYLDNLALQSFRREHESSLRGYVTTNTGSEDQKPARSKNPKKTTSSKARGRRHKRRSQQPTFYEPTLPASATQGWSDLLSRVTRELASDTFDIEEMKVRCCFLNFSIIRDEIIFVWAQVKMRNLEHQNGVLLAKYQAVMSMKDRRGPEGAQVSSPGLYRFE